MTGQKLIIVEDSRPKFTNFHFVLTDKCCGFREYSLKGTIRWNLKGVKLTLINSSRFRLWPRRNGIASYAAVILNSMKTIWSRYNTKMYIQFWDYIKSTLKILFLAFSITLLYLFHCAVYESTAKADFSFKITLKKLPRFFFIFSICRKHAENEG